LSDDACIGPHYNTLYQEVEGEVDDGVVQLLEMMMMMMVMMRLEAHGR